MPDPDFLTGCHGWHNQFDYPDDLPADWRLCYYSNELRSVIVPAALWSSIDQQAEQWMQDTDDEFKFVFEVPATELDNAAPLELFNVLQQRFNGYYRLPGSESTQQLIANQDSSWTVWRPDSGVEFPKTKTAVLVLTSSDDLTFLKQLANKLARHQDETAANVGLFSKNVEKSFEIAKQIKTLVELLGF